MLDRNIDKVERIIELTSNSGKKEQFRVGDVVDINYRKPFDPRGVGYNGDAGLTGRIADIKDTVIYVDAGTLFHSEVHILGTRYSIRIIDEDDYRYDREADGWCDPSVKEILIFNYKQSAESVKDLVAYQKKVLRHEIVHAFLYESGLWQNAYGSKCWAKNEEMIDWMAIQIPKIQRAYKEAYCDE